MSTKHKMNIFFNVIQSILNDIVLQYFIRIASVEKKKVKRKGNLILQFSFHLNANLKLIEQSQSFSFFFFCYSNINFYSTRNTMQNFSLKQH